MANDNEMRVTQLSDEHAVIMHEDHCAVMTVEKVQNVKTPPRCALCYQREGNPGDCVEGGERYAISFGAAGGVVLCRKAVLNLISKSIAASEATTAEWDV